MIDESPALAGSVQKKQITAAVIELDIYRIFRIISQ